MSLERPLRVLFAMVLLAQVGTALAGIALLERMTPAIGQILADNVASVRAVETMLAVLAARGTDDANGAVGAERRELFYDALAAAEGNVTEDAERATLARVRRDAADALGGDPSAHEDVVRDLVELADINQGAMHRADAEAIRLGSAGRWALAFFALLGLGGSAMAIRWARRHLLAPLAEIAATLEAYRSGASHRRCFLQRSDELREVLSTVNELLDRAERPLADVGDRDDVARMRALVTDLLDRQGAAMAVVDGGGALVAASREALDRIALEDRPVADALAREDAVVEVRGTDLRIVRL